MKVALVVVVLLGIASYALGVPSPLVGALKLKLLVSPEPFASEAEEGYMEVISELESKIKNSLEDVEGVSTPTGEFSLEKFRSKAYYDSPGDCHLLNSGYFLREKEPIPSDGSAEYTLQFTSPERYVAASAVSTDELKRVILPSYRHTFTHQSDVDSQVVEKTVENIMTLYPELDGAIEGFELSTEIEMIGKYVERQYKGFNIEIGPYAAEFHLATLFTEEDSWSPITFQLQISIEDENEGFDHQTLDEARAIFLAIQEALDEAGWLVDHEDYPTITADDGAHRLTLEGAAFHATNPDFCDERVNSIEDSSSAASLRSVFF
eukprot:CAMPEP_0174260522 /NCGR_PEP_ID=MMETSP0439-20130205/9821_1 /TAXON_ID=0 /ORGANISM="Stereomyxa ramosa, Strain Chinc5" /LENGTH=320 /DNA_ID=CAMNT_0015344779 /DNA_START=16 /DNA_END=978 /DNA_ORIENTATION=+